MTTAANQDKPDAVTLPELPLRDTFAIHIAPGFAGRVEWTSKQRALMIYELADAMLEVRTKGGDRDE